MLWSRSELGGWRLRAVDGALGEVEDFLFDDASWALRYLVADTSRWLPDRTVLIAPNSLGRPDEVSREIPVSLTMRQITDSPPIGTHEPVSWQMEQRMRAYYGWQPYFGGHNYDDAANNEAISQPPPENDGPDAHLRSMHSLKGYGVSAIDGHAGLLNDFQFDDEGWVVRYVAIDTGGWITGKRVVIAPAWIRGINWADREVDLEVTMDAILHSPNYEPSLRIGRDYERRLYHHYQRPPYWS